MPMLPECNPGDLAVTVGIDFPRQPLRRLNLKRHAIACHVFRIWKVGEAVDEIIMCGDPVVSTASHPGLDMSTSEP